MNLPNETMCILPWISIEASPVGTLRPCCMADVELVDEFDIKFNVTRDNLNDVRNSDQMYDLRSDFLEGKKPQMCRRCWAEEDAGRISKRQNTIKRMEHMISPTMEWKNQANDLMFIDLKLGNICNLKCRICGPWSSSAIASEETMLLPKNERVGTYSHDMLKLGAWPRKSETFWDNLYKNSANVKYLEFTGGEPLMIKEHLEYLDYLVKTKQSKDIEIHYNTNGTQYSDYAVQLWKNFKHVEIAFSIDNIGKRFEYERNGANWEEVNANIEKFIKLRDNSNNISLQLCCTINIFNVLYLKDVYHWEHYSQFDFVFWNMLHDGPQWCITSLPQKARSKVANVLMHSLLLPEKIQQEFNNVVNFMRQTPPTVTLEQVRSDIKRLDDRRGDSLKDSHPELWNLLYE